jgi:hypothetical protein
MKHNLITQKELDTLEQIDRDCISMHVCPPPKTFLNFKVTDAKGNEIFELIMKSNSWVRNAYNIMAMQIMGLNSNAGGTTYGAGKMGIKFTNGNTYATGNSVYANGTQYIASIGIDTRGIVVGTGTIDEDFEAYSLNSKISNGTSIGNLSYVNETTPTLSYDSTNNKITATLSRFFNNNSGGLITINETALYFVSDAISGSSSMVSRDKLSIPVPVPNTSQLCVTYTMEMTYPE